MSKFGRFTIKGSEKVEKYITNIIKTASDEIESLLTLDDYISLIMLGGYGRGEGGVLIKNDEELPHNNFDLLLITKSIPKSRENSIKKILDKKIDELTSRFNIGFDLSLIDENKLKNSDCRVMWYDMRFGHKVLFGDSEFVKSINKFNLENIPIWDIRNLLVNRGTLLVINDLILKKDLILEDEKKLIIKHTIKAIIGYGDALLYTKGLYDWSYQEKQSRMQKANTIDNEFKNIYDEAIEFRFRPDYDKYLNIDIDLWQKSLKSKFEMINLEIERYRLNLNSLEWDNYYKYAILENLNISKSSTKDNIKKSINLIRGNDINYDLGSIRLNLALRTFNINSILPIIFPLISYDLNYPKYKEFTKEILKNSSDDIYQLKKDYLNLWGIYMDTNFSNLLKKHNLL